ncbi:MAG: type II secretion system protein [Betaproteobacteria bacterium]
MSHASGKTNSIQTHFGVKRQPGLRCAGFTAPQLLIVLTIVGLLGGYFVPRFEFAAGVNAKSEPQPATAQAAAAGNCTQSATSPEAKQ